MIGDYVGLLERVCCNGYFRLLDFEYISDKFLGKGYFVYLKIVMDRY